MPPWDRGLALGSAQLDRRDFQTVLDFLQRLYAAKTLDDYVSHATRGLLELVPADICVYNECDPAHRRIKFVVEPVERELPDAPKLWAVHMHDHPFLKYWHGAFAERSLHRVVTLGDFVSRRQWRDRGLYTEFYRPNRIEHMMGVRLPAPGSLEFYMTIMRDGSDFSERDRAVLTLLRPHLVAAYENAAATDERGRELQLLREGLEERGRSLIVLGRDGSIRQMSECARNWLLDYFGPHWRDRRRLPASLECWVKKQELGASAGGGMPCVRHPLTRERDGRRLTVRLLAEARGLYLLMSEEKLRIEPGDLASLGLTRREAEVLAFVAAGNSNAAIAASLGLSPATIKHCVERIYAKLQVRTRAAAAAIAIRSADGSG
jgi:DNA-binding CsgD family transcriptional regulator